MNKVEFLPHGEGMNKVEFLPHGEGMNKVEFLPHGEGMNKVKFLPQVGESPIPATHPALFSATVCAYRPRAPESARIVERICRMPTSQVRLAIPPAFDLPALAGAADANLRAIEELYPVTVGMRDDQLVVKGETSAIAQVSTLLTDLMEQVSTGGSPSADDVREAASVLKSSEMTPSYLRQDTLLTYRGRAIVPKTVGQKRYVDAIRNNTVTFGIGPAGTGKTYLAMAMGVAALKRKEVARIVLTRPVVEAGESLGYLPGTLAEKVDPYVRPLYDALFDMTDREKGAQLIETGVIEIAPLAYMRGRTFNDAFLILDEAQNTTSEQMKMFLTRLGFGAKMVITGDDTQLDLPSGSSSLAHVRQILDGVDDVAFVELGRSDVVRHSLVARIVEAYERDAESRQLTLEGLDSGPGQSGTEADGGETDGGEADGGEVDGGEAA